ncbi:potassium transporter TrkA [Anaerobacillus arseniciselenatis]|uniref:Potassium transporter TrkA n=1 Tax=Anaerobacillus arseniciselenatis TaxID=85682 RepID=A0A1S2LCA3_9BACI|nr:cation:proton antiporter regulatory subunit [Anaerobacillus arseniciselenatis]OIJ09367.1 potassium transporter TrkA [Anaerobacillus arseniciselenatis]
MKVKVTDLPHIGKKVTLITAKREKINIISHYCGKRDLYFSQHEDDDEADYAVELSSQETRELGAQLLGATYQPVDQEQVKFLKGKLVMEWFNVSVSSKFVDKTITDSNIRQQTGVSIIAITRGDDTIITPAPDEVIKVGDTLMVAGKREHIDAFEVLVGAK